MAKQSPNPIDVQDFQFKLHCRLKIFENQDNEVFNKPCSLLVVSSRFGLVFVGTATSTLQVIQLNNIEKYSVKEGEIADYNCRTITLPSLPKHVSINCDSTKLAVVVEKNSCAIAVIYDVASFLKQGVTVLHEIRLSSAPGVSVVETSWNPTIPNVFTACKGDGTLGLYELKETGIEINELPAESQACCLCWSPKGKQIAVGSRDGRITQYKPDLRAAKVVNAPSLEEPHSVIAIQWISNYQFIALYKPLNTDGGSSLLVVDSPKTGNTVYTNYEDICYSYGHIRPVQFYMNHQAAWNILMVASSNSMEVGVLGSENEVWTQWILADAARAELPLSASKQETLPIGLAFDTSAVEPVLWGESSLPPAPFLLLLSHHGLLCCYRVINIKSGVINICQAPEPFADVSGLSQFIKAGPAIVIKTPTAEPQTQVTTTTLPSRSAVVSASTQLFTSSQLPQVPLFTTPNTSLFGIQQPPQIAKSEPTPIFKPDLTVLQTPLSFSKSVPQNVLTSSVPQPVSALASVTTVVPTVKATAVNSTTGIQLNESNIVQEEADLLISKLIREECEALEAELKALLHKAQSVKVDLGTDNEAVELVHGTDSLEDFLKEVMDTNSAQSAEVHSLKQALINTWAWYEDAQSRFAQARDATLEALLRIQQLDPVSQRYMADIQHMTYYMESQLIQASRALDEQWENFQDSCKKIMKLKIPTMEAIYQTMVRQSAIYQKQKYVLKDISSRIRAHRSKINGPSLLVSLNNADQLEKELRRLQLEPQHLLQAQYDRVLQNQQRLTSNKIQKLSKLLFEREITHVTVSKPQLSTTSLQTLLQSSVTGQNKNTSETLSGLSPILSNKPVAPRALDFMQSTPKVVEHKQSSVPVVALDANTFKGLPSDLSVKVSSTPAVATTTKEVPFPTATVATVSKSEPLPTMASLQFKFPTVPSTSMLTLGVSSSPNFQTANSTQLNFSFSQISPASKANNVPASVTITPVSVVSTAVATNKINQLTFTTPVSTSKPSVSVGSMLGTTKPSPTFNFTFTPAATTNSISISQASNIKPLASTASSAFVPTTQLAFNFNAKSTVAAMVPTSIITSSASSKPSAFVFGTTAPIFSSTTASISKPIVAPDTSKTFPTSSVANTTSVTVVSSTTTASGFSFFKISDSNVQTTNVFGSTTVATPAITTKTGELGSLGSPAVVALKATAPSLATISSPEISISITASGASAVKTTTSGVQGLLFGDTSTTSTQGTIFSFGNILANTSQIITPQVTSGAITSPASFSGVTTLSTTSSEKINENTTQSYIFAKPTATSVFGTSGTTTTTGSIFGASATISGSLFGSTATTVTTTSIFGSTTISGSMFGAQPTSSPSSAPSSITSTSSTVTPTAANTVFSSNAGTVAAMPSSIFSPTASSTTGFAAPATSSSIFSSPVTSASDFGTTVTSTSVFGPPITSSSSGFNDHTASVTTSFSFASSTVASSIFGATPATTSTSIFGSPGFGATSTPVFGQPVSSTPSAFATAASPAFGAPEKTTSGPFISAAFPSSTTNTFGSPPAFGTTTTASGSIFAQPSVFGSGSVFGAPASSSTNTFGTPASNSGFSSTASIFGAPNTAPNEFGQSQAQSFSFAAAAANVPNTNSGFGFSKPASAFGFGMPTKSTDSGSYSFGNLSMGTATTNASNVFGSPGFGQSSSSNPFAKPASQEQKNVFGGGSLFGTPSTTTASIFGGSSGGTGFGNSTFGSPGFGSPSTFGQQPTFSQSSFSGSFGGSPSQPGPFSGGNHSVAQSGFGSFGQNQNSNTGFGTAPVFSGSQSGFGTAPAFGSTSPGFGGAPAFGSPSKVFGSGASPTGTFSAAPQQQSSTFANLATQNTVGFGALAQQSQPTPGASPFSGGSSFSTWR